jgi:hypothetical protein
MCSYDQRQPLHLPVDTRTSTMSDTANKITVNGTDIASVPIAPVRVEKSAPDAYRLVRFRAEDGATHFKLQGHFTWTQGWSQRGGEWRDIETVDADDLSDDKPYGRLL